MSGAEDGQNRKIYMVTIPTMVGRMMLNGFAFLAIKRNTLGLM